MYEIRTTEQFDEWFSRLGDLSLQLRLSARFDHIISGNFGDWRPIGQGVGELRYHFGPGYRIYFTRRGRQVILLLAGGDKSSQPRDIEVALKLAKLEKTND